MLKIKNNIQNKIRNKIRISAADKITKFARRTTKFDVVVTDRAFKDKVISITVQTKNNIIS
jgi:translation initiation factor IF-1